MLRETNPNGMARITCHNADCDNDEHCFRPKRSGKAWANPTGDCKYCGENPVNWERVRNCDLSDFAALEDELRNELEITY